MPDPFERWLLHTTLLLYFRGRFEGVCASLFRKTLEPISALLAEAEVTKDNLDHVCYRQQRGGCFLSSDACFYLLGGSGWRVL